MEAWMLTFENEPLPNVKCDGQCMTVSCTQIHSPSVENLLYLGAYLQGGFTFEEGSYLQEGAYLPACTVFGIDNLY